LYVSERVRASIADEPFQTHQAYWVRLYRPRDEILNGTWKFPEAQPVP
jgi:hypothetical protein